MPQATPIMTSEPGQAERGGAMPWDMYTRTPSVQARRLSSAQRQANWRAAQVEARDFLTAFEALSQKLAARLRLLRLVHEAARWTPARREAALATLSANNGSLAQAILERMAEDASLAGRIQLALDRFSAATEAARDAERALRPEQGLVPLLDLPGLKGKLYMISTLDLLFAGEPVLGRMFPRVERQAGVLAFSKPDRPAPAPPAEPFNLVASLKRLLDEAEARQQA